MNDELIFRIIFILLYTVFGAIRLYYRIPASIRERSREKKADSYGGKARIAISVISLVLWSTIALYLLSPPWMLWSQLPVPAWLRWTGLGVGIISLPFLIWTHSTLGKYYSSSRLELKEDHKLVTGGPYSRVRHPMYTVLCTFGVAISLFSANLILLLFSTILIIPFYALTKNEEKMMLERFGEEYRAYMRRTGRLLPRRGTEKG